MTFPIVHSSIHLYPQLPTYPLRSLQVSHMYDPCDIVVQYYSNLQVLESAAGFYIGTLFTPPTKPGNTHPYPEPGSRDSTYFPHLIQAQTALDYLEVLALSGKSRRPFDLQVWEAKFTHLFKLNVKYRLSP